MTVEWLYELDEVGQCPLTRASMSGRTEVVNLMMLREMEDDPEQYWQLPDLHRAACWGFDDVVDALLEKGADPAEHDTQGETALHKAARLGNLDAAISLVRAGAPINEADSLGMTPLHWAAITGNLDVSRLLLAHYADIYAQDYFAGGITPRGIAKLMGYEELIKLMDERGSLYTTELVVEQN